MALVKAIVNIRRILMGFGDRLKAIRIRNGVTQKQLAEKMGYQTNSYISDAENNKFIPTEDKLREWADIIGVSWEEIKEIQLDEEIKTLGIKDAAFTMMFKDIPNLTLEEKQSIIDAYQAVLKARAEKAK
jgi:transcriptional regulator with XRE-family HTH domain